MFKKLFTIILITLMLSGSAFAYQTALITYPEYNKNWKQVYFGKQNNEAISQWIPAYEQSNNWSESVVFHSYNWAKGNNCYKFMSNLLANVGSQNNTMQSWIIKDKPEDYVAMLFYKKTKKMEFC